MLFSTFGSFFVCKWRQHCSRTLTKGTEGRCGKAAGALFPRFSEGGEGPEGGGFIRRGGEEGEMLGMPPTSYYLHKKGYRI